MGEHLYKIGRSSVTEKESVLNTLTPSVVPFPFIMGWFTIHGTNVTALSVPTVTLVENQAFVESKRNHCPKIDMKSLSRTLNSKLVQACRPCHSLSIIKHY